MSMHLSNFARIRGTSGSHKLTWLSAQTVLASLFLAASPALAEVEPPAHLLPPLPALTLVPTPQSVQIDSADQKISLADAEIIVTQNPAIQAEGYELSLSLPEGQSTPRVSISVSSPAGLHNANATLSQLRQITSRNPLPALTIRDFPRFPWRGLMIDVSRHYFSVPELKTIVDGMSAFKLNILHLHLTDGPGWRFHSVNYPLLTQKSAWRPAQSNGWNWKDVELQEHSTQTPNLIGGFYTREDLQALVAYAKTKNVAIIPEIDFPGHFFSALNAYPSLMCEGNSLNGPAKAGCDNLCLGKSESHKFIVDILKEIIAAFPPNTPIHIGGDEVSHEIWRKCSHCQEYMRRNQLLSTAELQRHFLAEVMRELGPNIPNLIVWNDSMDVLPNGKFAVNIWTNPQEVFSPKAPKSASYIFSCGDYFYFDKAQADPATEPRAMDGVVSLEKTYSFTVPILPDHSEKQILGVQGNLWTEYVPDIKHAQYMIFPRACALAEIAWSAPAGPNRNYPDFLRRLQDIEPSLKATGVHFRPYSAKPAVPTRQPASPYPLPGPIHTTPGKTARTWDLPAFKN